ncbi:hypothetical protein D9M73_264180 [compost metagenome]
MDGDDGRMAQGREHARFPEETVDEGFVVQPVQHLHRHLAVEGFLGGQVNLGHPALAQASVHEVAGDVEKIVGHGFRFFGVGATGSGTTWTCLPPQRFPATRA